MPIPPNDYDKNTCAQPYILCKTCTGIITAAKDHLAGGISTRLSLNERPVVAKYLVPDLQRSALNGCHLCSIISQTMAPAHSVDDIQLESSSTTRFIVTIKIGSYAKTAEWFGTSKNLAFLDTWLEVQDPTSRRRLRNATVPIVTDPTPYATIPPKACWSLSTESDAMFDLAKEWLHGCRSEHKLCEEVRLTAVSSSNQSESFPEYLVNVNDDGSLRLCPSASIIMTLEGRRPSYLTLSHRWGKSRPFTLTSKNLPSLLVDIPFSSLPKTFQDAVIITRRMEYSYIWIDSLCIIQDSREHWEQESSIMGDIYRASAFTIAALGAKDGSDGCFKARNPLCFQHFAFEQAPGQKLVYISPGIEKRSLKFTGHGPNVEPLHQRAWVMQERMLSPRTLFYGSTGIYWECMEQEASSTKPARSSFASVKYSIHKACEMTVSGRFDESYRAFWNWWTSIITTYNPCGLTYGTDKLVALGGIIKLVASKTGMHNVAGMWREYIRPELLWFVDTPAVRPIGPAYQAPTWSWACLNSEVGIGIQDFAYEFNWTIDVLDAVAHEVAKNGQISSASITLRGPLLRVRWELIDDCYKLRWGDATPLEDSADDRVIFLPDAVPDPGKEIWALQVVHATAAHTYMNMGIVITRENDGDDTWVRVGSFRQYDWPSNPTTFFQDGLAETKTVVIL